MAAQMKPRFEGWSSPGRGQVGARLRGRRVLVTGAGGSIGAALCDAIGQASPASLMLLDASEYALYEIDRRLRSPHVSVLGSVGDAGLLGEAFELHRPQVVFHAAAFKQVPLLEHQPFAAIANNVLGTYELLQAAMRHGVEEFVLVSTDKAVDPASIMGASKRIAELLVMAWVESGTRMSAVRLGNVWGSHGSVVELFREQIAGGGPVTITHAEARRFFMSMEDAVGAILSALEPRTHGTILVPELGEPVRILDVARRLMDEHGSSAAIAFTGLRPGDKLVEAMVSDREAWMDAADGLALRAIASPGLSERAMTAAVEAMRQAVERRDLEGLVGAVGGVVSEYTPSAVLRGALRQANAGQEAHA